MQLFILVCIVLGVLSNTANTLPTTTTASTSSSSSSSATTTEKSHHHDDEPELRTTTNASNSAEGDEESEDEEEEDDDDIEEAPEVAPAHAAAAADGASSGMSSNPQLEQQKIQDSKQHGGPHASLLHHLIMKRATEEGQDDLMGSAQTIRGYAPNVAPYANSNTRFADYHRSRPNTRPLGGGGGGGSGGDFKPYATAFSPQTAQRLSSLRVNTSSKRFGFRG